MKKITIILLLFAFVTSCNRHVVQNVYENTVSEDQLETLYVEMGQQLDHYSFDIPLNEWMRNTMVGDTSVITQCMARKIVDNNTRYLFVFTEYDYPTINYYTFLVRYVGKRKQK